MHQRVLHVELLVQRWTEQVTGLRLRRLRTHGTPWRNLQKTGAGKTITCKSCAYQSAQSRVESTTCEFFRADYVALEYLVGQRRLLGL